MFATGKFIPEGLKALMGYLAEPNLRNDRRIIPLATIAKNKKTQATSPKRAAAPSLLQSKRGNLLFGHQIRPTLRTTRYFHIIMLTLLIACELDWDRAKQLLMSKVDADGGHRSKKNVDFRERKIIAYENRIRKFSTPDKIFRYFATVILRDETQTTVYMTPEDFLRSIFPGIKQPEGLGLDRYRRYDPESMSRNLNLNLEDDSIFYQLSSSGLITLFDYMFLLAVLSISSQHFEIAFRIFDFNGDGLVDCEEFKMVMRQQTTMDTRRRDNATTGNSKDKAFNSALLVYFFGPNMDEKLTIEKFLKFQKRLQREIHLLEFMRKHPNEEGKITEADFADLLLAYAGYEYKVKQKKLRRVKREFKNRGQGISKQDYLDFFQFVNEINDVDTALTFYHMANASIDKQTLQHVAKTVALVKLSDHVVDVIFTIFDSNRDNHLSNKQFISVMKNRAQRGLQKPKHTGFLHMMSSIFKCARKTTPVLSYL